MTKTNTTTRQTDLTVQAWRWIAVVLAISQLASPVIITRVFGDFLSTGATNAALITPAGYAFTIWGLITLLSALTCAAIVRSGLDTRWELRVLVEMSIAFVGFSTWLVVAAQGWLWFSVFVFAIMNAALIDVVRLLVRHPDDLGCPAWLRLLATLTFGLYLGWSSVAVFVNVAAALIDAGWSASGIGWQATILITATTASIALTILLRGTPGYVVAAGWALIAAAIGAADRGSTLLAGASSVAVVLVVVAAAICLGTGRRRPPTEPNPSGGFAVT